MNEKSAAWIVIRRVGPCRVPFSVCVGGFATTIPPSDDDHCVQLKVLPGACQVRIEAEELESQYLNVDLLPDETRRLRLLPGKKLRVGPWAGKLLSVAYMLLIPIIILGALIAGMGIGFLGEVVGRHLVPVMLLGGLFIAGALGMSASILFFRAWQPSLRNDGPRDGILQRVKDCLGFVSLVAYSILMVLFTIAGYFITLPMQWVAGILKRGEETSVKVEPPPPLGRIVSQGALLRIRNRAVPWQFLEILVDDRKIDTTPAYGQDMIDVEISSGVHDVHISPRWCSKVVGVRRFRNYYREMITVEFVTQWHYVTWIVGICLAVAWVLSGNMQANPLYPWLIVAVLAFPVAILFFCPALYFNYKSFPKRASREDDPPVVGEECRITEWECEAG